MSLRFIHSILLSTAAAAFLLCSAPDASAANYTVTHCGDSIPPQEGSFRYLLDIANSTPSSDIIQFPPEGGGCVVTPVAPFVVNGSLWVQAGGGGTSMRFRLITDGQLNDQTLFQLEAGDIHLGGLEIFGQVSQRAIYVGKNATLSFHSGRIHGFKEPTSAADPAHISGGLGGGVLAYNNLAIRNSYVQHCSADWGGAVAYLPGGSLHSFSFSKSIAEYNTSHHEGGAFLLGSPSTALSFYNFYEANVYNNTSGADGGAVYAAFGDMIVKNSTFIGNETPSLGGALYQYGGELNARFNTLVDNISWGGYGRELRTEGTSVYLNSNILGYSNTWTGGSSMSCYLSAPPVLSVNNVMQEGSCSWGSTGNTISADMGLSGPSLHVPASPAYGPPFAFLWLFGLDSNSPALNHGDPTQCGQPLSLPTDQRGYSRPSVCDAGAFERSN